MKNLILLCFVVVFSWNQVVHGARPSVEWSVNSDQGLHGLLILSGHGAGFSSTFGCGNLFLRIDNPETEEIRFFDDNALLGSGSSGTLLMIRTKEDWKNLPPPSILDSKSIKTLPSIIVFSKSTRTSA